MSVPTQKQIEALRLIVGAVLDSIKAVQPHGAPAGVIYAALMAQGCSKNQFDSLMSGLVKTGKITHDNEAHLYYMA